MKLTYASLRNFKRFSNAHIKEIEMEFQAPVQIIVGSNGCGKSSMLRELSPLPSTRTDYDQNGRKELHFEQDGHLFKLVSDFTNRVSPHSFVMDGVELNSGHTSDIQEELAIKHFGFTPAIRNLVYGKTQICSMTPVNRKEMFLKINPMDLGLILSTHKNALQKFKDCKANLQLLYTRKANLEAKMLKPEILKQHLATKEKLSNELLAIDKILYALEQHVRTLKDKYQEELAYQQQCADNNQQLIPSTQILTECKEIISYAHNFTHVVHGENYAEAKNTLHLTKSKLDLQKTEISRMIQNLSAEINEYQSHLNTSVERNASVVEKELKTVTDELSKYQNLPENPLPERMISTAEETLRAIQPLVMTFRDMDVKMLPLEELNTLTEQEYNLTHQLEQLNGEINSLKNTLQEQEKELAQYKEKASIPDSCVSETCGLRLIFSRRLAKVEETYTSNQTKLATLTQQQTELCQQVKTVSEKLAPYKKWHAIENMQQLLSQLRYSFYNLKDWDKCLLEYLQQQPTKILKDISEYIEQSKLCLTRNQLVEQKERLTTELDVLVKSSKTSLGFLQQKTKEKEALVKEKLTELSALEQQSQAVDEEYALYLGYAAACDKIREFQKIYTRGERALMVSHALKYWKDLGKKFLEAKRLISEDLRALETVVHEQEVIQQSYQSETLALIDNVAKDKLVYEKIITALSPNSGIPHNSMVKYLNLLIKNANYFISQLWNFRLELLPVDMRQQLDYRFRIQIGSEIASDLNKLSDGQTEIINLVWELTLLLQMKMLNRIPLYEDELGRCCDVTHRNKILAFLNRLVTDKLIEQMFLINHFAALSDGFTDSDVICLNRDNIPEVPQDVNRNVRIINL